MIIERNLRRCEYDYPPTRQALTDHYLCKPSSAKLADCSAGTLFLFDFISQYNFLLIFQSADQAWRGGTIVSTVARHANHAIGIAGLAVGS